MNLRISNFLQKKIRAGQNRQLFSNFMSLSVLQAANYVLPLLTLPYLIRVLGADKFGLLAFATAIITYFSILTDYGFNLSATREVSINRQHKAELNAVFSAVMILKMALLLGGFALMTLIVFANDKFAAHWPVFFLTFGTVLGQALFPVWFFQGMEEMKYVTYLNIAAKSAFTVLVFVLVRSESDYLIVPALTSAGGIIAGAWSLFIVGRKFEVRFQWQGRDRLAAEMKKGWHIFVATSFGSLYRESNTVILGFMGSSAIVGYYAIAEKIVKAIQSVQTPVGQALFPHLARKEGSNVLRDYVLKHWKAVTAAYGLLWLAVFASATLIVHRLAGAADARVLLDFRILSPIIFVGGLNFYFGVLGLLSTGRSKAFSAAVGVAGGFNVFACLFLSYLFKDAGAASAVLASELVLLVLIVRNVLKESRSDLAA